MSLMVRLLLKLFISPILTFFFDFIFENESAEVSEPILYRQLLADMKIKLYYSWLLWTSEEMPLISLFWTSFSPMHFKLPFIKPKSIKPNVVSDEEKRCIVNWLSKNIILNCCDLSYYLPHRQNDSPVVGAKFTVNMHSSPD